MYVLRLAVELGQCDPSKWKEAQQQLLVEPPKQPTDLKGLYSTREDVHALLPASTGDSLHGGGVFSRLTESRGELTRLIECGQARLAKLNVLLLALWSDSAHTTNFSSTEGTGALNDIVGVVIGESRLRPELALRLFSALGGDVVRRASSGAEGVSPALARDVASLRLTSKGVVDEGGRRAAVAATELCAVLRITEALAKRNEGSLAAELAQRGAALQGELRVHIKAYSRPDRLRHREEADVLGAAGDFVAELPPEPSEHGPGSSRLDLMEYLLGVVTSGYEC